MHATKREWLRQFASELRTAVDDCRLERQRPAVTYYDADVVLHCLAGLQFQKLEALPNPSEPRMVVRALLLAGVFGNIRMLRPHLVEFYRKLRSWHPSLSAVSEEGSAQVVRYASSSWGLNDFVERLQRASTVEDSQHRKARLANLLLAEGFENFVKAELCYGGGWEARLARLRDQRLLVFAPLSSGDTFSLSSPRARTFLTVLDRVRPDKRANNLVDSSALDALCNLAEQNRDTLLYFHSDTHEIAELRDSPEVRRVLRAAFGEQRPMPFRSSDYLLIRLCFPSLLWSGNGVELARNDDELEPIAALAATLLELLDGIEAEEKLLEAVSRLEFNGRPLDLVIDEFRQIRLLQGMIQSGGIGEDLTSMASRVWNAAVSDTDKRAAEEAIDQAIVETWQELDKRVGFLRSWREQTVGMARSIEVRSKAWSGKVPTMDLDLGLGRWGLEESVVEREQLDLWLSGIASGNEGDWWLVAGDVAARMLAGVPTHRDGRQILVVLWALGNAGRLVDCWNTWSRGGWRDSDFEVLFLVSRARQLKFLPATARADCTIFEEIRELARLRCADRDPRLHGLALMGVAHVCYWGWRIWKERSVAPDFIWALRAKEVGSVRLVTGNMMPWELGETLAIESLDAAWAASSALPGASLAQAFAWNHCAYVGLLMGGGDRRADDAWRKLNSLLASFETHYRFVDTLALKFTLGALRAASSGESQSGGGEESDAAAREEVCQNLCEAARLLERVYPFFGDREVEEQLRLVKAKRSDWKCGSSFLRDLAEPRER